MSEAGRGLRVEVSGVLVGTLLQEREGRMRFRPDAQWIADGQLPRLSLSQLTEPGPRVATVGLPTWFEHLLPPVGGALRRRIAGERALRETDSRRLLAALGSDLPGAVVVTGQSADTDGAEKQEFHGVSGLITFSLAGMQLKFSMIQQGDRFTLPAVGESGEWIVKVPGIVFPEQVEVESATMSWVSATGLAAADTRILPVEVVQVGGLPEGHGKALASRRFDRPDGGGRIHQEDFAQALEVSPQYIYSDGGDRRFSYDGLAQIVHGATELEGLFLFIDHLAFVIAAGDGDAHLKNWSFQFDDIGRARLSPAYDRLSIISWPEDYGWRLKGGARLALSLGRTRRFAHLDRAALKTFAARAQAPDGEARFMAALERAKDAWPSIAPIAPPRMREALREHWANVPLLREIGGLGG